MIKKILVALAVIASVLTASLAVQSPAQAAGWTNNGCKTISGSINGDAVVCMNFFTLQSGNQFLLTSVKLCLNSPTGSNSDLHNNAVIIKGSGGNFLGSTGVGTVPRNGCTSAALNIRGGAGMMGNLESTLNLDPWPPLYAPDQDFTMCRQVVNSGGC